MAILGILLVRKLAVYAVDQPTQRRGEKVFGSTDLALESARIVEFCGKSSGLADFENTVDR